jgi:hypothetical protein
VADAHAIQLGAVSPLGDPSLGWVEVLIPKVIRCLAIEGLGFPEIPAPVRCLPITLSPPAAVGLLREGRNAPTHPAPVPSTIHCRGIAVTALSPAPRRCRSLSLYSEARPVVASLPSTWRTAAYADAVAESRLAGYWPLLSGDTPGVVGSGVPFGVGPLPPLTVATIEVWAKREAGATDPWLAFGVAPVHGDTGRPFAGDVGAEAGLPVYLAADAIGTDLLIADGAWHQYVAIVDSPARTIALYRDGTFVRTDTLTVNLSQPPANHWGAWGDPGGWYVYASGSLAYVALYDAALTPWRIAWHHALLHVGGTSALALSSAQLSAIGHLLIAGAGAWMMPPPNGAAVAVEAMLGSGAWSLLAAQLDAAAAELLAGTGAVDLSPATLEAIAAELLAGSGGWTLPASRLDATAVEALIGTAAFQLFCARLWAITWPLPELLTLDDVTLTTPTLERAALTIPALAGVTLTKPALIDDGLAFPVLADATLTTPALAGAALIPLER